MSPIHRLLIAVPFALGLAAAGGCASKKPIDATSPEAVIAAVDKGDSVKVTTRNDVVHKFVVTKITNKALYGQNARVVYEDMTKVEVLDKEKRDDDGEGGFWSKLF